MTSKLFRQAVAMLRDFAIILMSDKVFMVGKGRGIRLTGSEEIDPTLLMLSTKRLYR